MWQKNLMVVNCRSPSNPIVSIVVIVVLYRLAVPTFIPFISWHVQTITGFDSSFVLLMYSFLSPSNLFTLPPKKHSNPHYLQSFLEETRPIHKHLAQVLLVQWLKYYFKFVSVAPHKGAQPFSHSTLCLDCGFADSKLNWIALVECAILVRVEQQRLIRVDYQGLTWLCALWPGDCVGPCFLALVTVVFHRDANHQACAWGMIKCHPAPLALAIIVNKSSSPTGCGTVYTASVRVAWSARSHSAAYRPWFERSDAWLCFVVIIVSCWINKNGSTYSCPRVFLFCFVLLSNKNIDKIKNVYQFILLSSKNSFFKKGGKVQDCPHVVNYIAEHVDVQ